MNKASSSTASYQAQDLVIGGGIAGIVTALELLDRGRTVVLLDADTEQRLGGLALWAFGGMALVGTPEQRRMGVKDSPDLCFEDWIRFGELDPDDEWPLAWARCYADESKTLVYDWVKALGLKFMPAVNLVERGETVKGNSVPRYHILWGTGRKLVQTLIERLRNHDRRKQLTLLHLHRATALTSDEEKVTGCIGIDDSSGRPFEVFADHTIVATGGINGTVEKVRENWPPDCPAAPDYFLNGASPLSDGAIHESAAAVGGRLTHLQQMWNYAAGIPHPQPHFEGHGLSLIPCKTSLWLSPGGEPLGPAPMVTGFDTHGLCRQVLEHPYTWQILNWKILIKELAISGAEHNAHILHHRFFRFMKDLLLGNKRLANQMLSESPEFITADNWQDLANKMNELTGEALIKAGKIEALAERFDQAMADPSRHAGHPEISRILQIREWRTDRLRTCNLQPIGDSKARPLIAIRLRFISRKSLGGLQTDLQCRVLDSSGRPLPGLFAVGEAAGFGGGGASGKRSIEGNFLSGCILTARKAAEHIG